MGGGEGIKDTELDGGCSAGDRGQEGDLVLRSSPGLPDASNGACHAQAPSQSH